MNVGKTVFSQLMEFVPQYEFQKCVERYQGNYKIKSFPAGINSFVWVLTSSPIGKVSETSKPAFGAINKNSIIWAFVETCLAIP